VTLEQLGILLELVWGYQGAVHVVRDFVSLRKTSPSGGGLHSVEVFPYIRSVSDIPAGVYHYNVRSNELQLMRQSDAESMKTELIPLLAGQEYFADACVVFVLAVRFDRLHWKYARHERAFMVVLMEIGHLAQSFQLLCTELGLGSFVTAAINSADLDDSLELDGKQASALAVVGCGSRDEGPTPLHPRMETCEP
jgi:SagB-type dehydrogenase family enzyme